MNVGRKTLVYLFYYIDSIWFICNIVFSLKSPLFARTVVEVYLLAGWGAVPHPYNHHLQGCEASVTRQQQPTPQHVPVTCQDDTVDSNREFASVCEEYQETEWNKQVSTQQERGGVIEETDRGGEALL